MGSSSSGKERGAMEQTLSRAVRDNLAMLQRTSEDLYHAVADLVAACASSRPINALPPMLRAQTAAAALGAALEVLSRFITAAARAMSEGAVERGRVHPVAVDVPEPVPAPALPRPRIPTPMAMPHTPVAGPEEIETPVEAAPAAEVELSSVHLPEPPFETPTEIPESEDEASAAALLEARAAGDPGAVEAEPVPFDLANLPPEEQELHRRANRVAKVSMQDIELMRPEDVRLGRQQKDICKRLRHDLDKARREYERRFGAILSQPVDYFHYWMVEILAAGDTEALGEYPYPSPVVGS